MTKRFGRIMRATGLSALALGIATTGVSAARPAAHPQSTVTLTIGTSVPLSSGLKPLADGINKSVQLAVSLANESHKVPGVTFKTRLLDDTVGTNYSADKDAANARTLIADSTVVGEVGPLNSGAAEASMPIYNNASLVQISPANTLVLLTDPSNLAKFQPATASGKTPRTYFRTAVNDANQGKGDVRFAHQILHLNSVYVVDNKDPYATGLAQQFLLNAKKFGMNIAGSGELEPAQPQMGARALATVIKNTTGGNLDMVFFAGEFGPSGGAEFMLSALRHVGMMHTVFMGPDGMFSPAFITGATPAIAEGAYASNVGYPTNAKNVKVPAPAVAFSTAFKKQYPGVDIAGYDTPAYDAANIIIQAVANGIKNGSFKLGGSIQANRSAVAKAVAAISDFSGATGQVSFDKNGDTSIHAVISMYKVVNGAFQFVGYLPGYAPR
jgi:branched-chain amino acid transport system substrate-binding protein